VGRNPYVTIRPGLLLARQKRPSYTLGKPREGRSISFRSIAKGKEESKILTAKTKNEGGERGLKKKKKRNNRVKEEEKNQ